MMQFGPSIEAELRASLPFHQNFTRNKVLIVIICQCSFYPFLVSKLLYNYKYQSVYPYVRLPGLGGKAIFFVANKDRGPTVSPHL